MTKQRNNFISYKRETIKSKTDSTILVNHQISTANLSKYTEVKAYFFGCKHDNSKWIRQAESITFDFSETTKKSAPSWTSDFPNSFAELVTHLQEAIINHIEFMNEYCDAPPPSKESAKNFLYLIPILAPYDPDISIDSTNGCINITVHNPKVGVLTSQVGPEGKIYYSFASRGDKIFKITGTAKFKTANDHLQFKRVLSLL